MLAVVLAARPLPAAARRRGSRSPGSAALTAWTALSLAWAPLAGAAVDDLQRALLYLGALVAAGRCCAAARAARAAEPALLAGALVVAGYGLSSGSARRRDARARRCAPAAGSTSR